MSIEYILRIYHYLDSSVVEVRLPNSELQHRELQSLYLLNVLRLNNDQLTSWLTSDLDHAFMLAGVSAVDSDHDILGSVCSSFWSDHTDGDSSKQGCWRRGIFIGKQKLGKW